MAAELRNRKLQGSDLESINTSDLQNRLQELETLNSSLKKLLDVSRRRERKLVKVLEDMGAEYRLDSDLNEDVADDLYNCEPDFFHSMIDRSCWLVGLLIFQSLSSFILKYNEDLLQTHPVIVYFLTMLVGAGGNAGNQATVRVIRSLAVGSLTKSNMGTFLWREFLMALLISGIMGICSILRVWLFSATPFLESIAISTALVVIVGCSIVCGSILPLTFNFFGIDPAHSSTTIQVIMDITGVVITCFVATHMLDHSKGIAGTTSVNIIPAMN